MKKILAIALAMVLALSLSVATFAATADMNLDGMYENDIYFDEELNPYMGGVDEEMAEEYDITDATLLYPILFTDLGHFFNCTNHGDCGVSDYDFFKMDDDEFQTTPVVNAKLTTNEKYAKFAVVPFSVEDQGVTIEGVLLAITPIDLYIAKDIEIEGQFYVIRNLAARAHKSPVVTFTLTITNPYISDKDIDAVAGECELYLDNFDSYVIKTAQFAEAGENGLTLEFLDFSEPMGVTVELPSVVGQNGVNFKVVDGFALNLPVPQDPTQSSAGEPEYEFVVENIPDSVIALSETASWVGRGFGSTEAIVNGAKVTVAIDAAYLAEIFDLHDHECDCEYCEVEYSSDLYYYLLDAEGYITYLGSFDAKDKKAPEALAWDVAAGDALGMLLISDEKFDTNVPADEEPETSEPETSEPEDDKEAPSTGSSEMISVAVAFAAVTVVAAGALSFKKSR